MEQQLQQQQQSWGGRLWGGRLHSKAERAPEHMTVRRETCRVESHDGFRVLVCEELREVFRCAADGHREIVEKTESTSVRPYSEQPSTSSAASRYDEAVRGPLGPVVSASLGQMLDDFFQYAAELQESLEQQDAAGSSSSWAPWSSSSSSSDGTDSSGSRLFSWWQRRTPTAAAGAGAAAASLGPGGAAASQPSSLTQLVREQHSSSDDAQETC